MQRVSKYDKSGPYFRKVEDTNKQTIYVSEDNKHRTVYNKKTHEIFYDKEKENCSYYRFKKDTN